MPNIIIESSALAPVHARRTEHVERKGIGHPDTVCDCVMEAASLALSHEYIATCGRVLHHNLDKGLTARIR